MTKVGWNYGAKNKCPLCSVADDTQEHILSCSKLCPNSMTDDCDLDLNNFEPYIKNLEAAIRRRETAIEERAKEKRTQPSSRSSKIIDTLP